MTTLAFIDIETTGLSAENHEVWEVALIRRDVPDPKSFDITIAPDDEHVWQLPVDLGSADAMALRVGRFHERRATELYDTNRFASEFANYTHGAWFVGANPSFDAAFLERLLRQYGQCPTWHHRLICVETLWAGRNGTMLPPGLDAIAVDYGMEDRDDRHTALGDARMARDVYDAVKRDWQAWRDSDMRLAERCDAFRLTCEAQRDELTKLRAQVLETIGHAGWQGAELAARREQQRSEPSRESWLT